MVHKENYLKQILRDWDWLLVIAVAPILIFPRAEYAWLLLLYPLILGLQWWSSGQVLPLTPFNPAVLVLSIMMVISIFITPDPLNSLGKLAGLLLGMLIFFTVVRHNKTRKGLKQALGLYIVAGIGVSVVSLFTTSWLPSRSIKLTNLLSRLPIRLTGLLGAENGINVNELAGALLWVVPLVVMAACALLVEPRWFASRSGRGKIRAKQMVAWSFLLFIGILMCVGVLVLSQSRDGFLAIAATSPILLILIAKGKYRYWIMGFFVIFMLAGIILINHIGLQVILDHFFQRLPAEGTAGSVDALFGRVEIWKQAVAAIHDHPLTGLGMNMFRKSFYVRDLAFPNPGLDIAHAHNELLQASLDLGFPGLVGFLALYAVSLGILARRIRENGAVRLLSIGLLGGLLAHFLFGLTDAVAMGAKPGFLFWWLLGLVCGFYSGNKPIKVLAYD
jgi:putative inorganic carbon (HCO3(-)) transporter